MRLTCPPTTGSCESVRHADAVNTEGDSWRNQTPWSSAREGSSGEPLDAVHTSRWRKLQSDAVEKAALGAAAELGKIIPTLLVGIRGRRTARRRVLIDLEEGGLMLVGACRDRSNHNGRLAEFLVVAGAASRALTGRMIGDMQTTGLVSATPMVGSLRELAERAVDAVNAAIHGRVERAVADAAVDALDAALTALHVLLESSNG